MSVLDKQPCSLPTVNSLSGVLHCVVIVVVHCLDLHCSKLQTIPKNHSYIMYLHVHVYTYMYAVNSLSGVCHCVVICIAFGYRRTPIYMYIAPNYKLHKKLHYVSIIHVHTQTEHFCLPWRIHMHCVMSDVFRVNKCTVL